MHWKYRVFGRSAGQRPKPLSRYNRRLQKTYESERFYTKNVFKELRDAFYPHGKKIVPLDIAARLDELALAVWFMDDGSKGAKAPRNPRINTSSFTEVEQVILVDALEKRFGVLSHHIGIEGKFFIVIEAEGFESFAQAVLPHLIPSMRYKLPYPVTTARRTSRRRSLPPEGNLRSP